MGAWVGLGQAPQQAAPGVHAVQPDDVCDDHDDCKRIDSVDCLGCAENRVGSLRQEKNTGVIEYVWEYPKPTGFNPAGGFSARSITPFLMQHARD